MPVPTIADGAWLGLGKLLPVLLLLAGCRGGLFGGDAMANTGGRLLLPRGAPLHLMVACGVHGYHGWPERPVVMPSLPAMYWSPGMAETVTRAHGASAWSRLKKCLRLVPGKENPSNGIVCGENGMVDWSYTWSTGSSGSSAVGIDWLVLAGDRAWQEIELDAIFASIDGGPLLKIRAPATRLPVGASSTAKAPDVAACTAHLLRVTGADPVLMAALRRGDESAPACTGIIARTDDPGDGWTVWQVVLPAGEDPRHRAVQTERDLQGWIPAGIGVGTIRFIVYGGEQHRWRHQLIIGDDGEETDPYDGWKHPRVPFLDLRHLDENPTCTLPVGAVDAAP